MSTSKALSVSADTDFSIHQQQQSERYFINSCALLNVMSSFLIQPNAQSFFGKRNAFTKQQVNNIRTHRYSLVLNR